MAFSPSKGTGSKQCPCMPPRHTSCSEASTAHPCHPVLLLPPRQALPIHGIPTYPPPPREASTAHSWHHSRCLGAELLHRKALTHRACRKRPVLHLDQHCTAQRRDDVCVARQQTMAWVHGLGAWPGASPGCMARVHDRCARPVCMAWPVCMRSLNEISFPCFHLCIEAVCVMRHTYHTEKRELYCRGRPRWHRLALQRMTRYALYGPTHGKFSSVHTKS